MRDPRCDQCRQAIRAAVDGLRCACQVMAWEDVRRFLVVYELIPEPWPVLDVLDRLAPLAEPSDER